MAVGSTTSALRKLFHRTSKESADALRAGEQAVTKEPGFFVSNRRDGQASGYGDDVVEMTVPEKDLVLDDEFPDGEKHYRINPDSLVHDLSKYSPKALAALLTGGVAAVESDDAEAGVITRGGKRLIEAWHGSPHQFDRFDISKIGTGEGAQSYGHGLYFADSPAVAKGYRDDLVSKWNNTSSDINGISQDEFMRSLPADERELLRPHLTDLKEAIDRGWIDDISPDDDMVDLLRERISSPDYEVYSHATNSDIPMAYDEGLSRRLSDRLESVRLKPAEGALYRTEIDVDPDTLLDYDKPLSEQSEAVQDAVRVAAAAFYGKKSAPMYDSSRKGADILEDMANWFGQKKTADMLHEAGIPGIRYRDGVSRGDNAAEGTYNYVMFDDKPISITERGAADPQMLALLGGGALAAGASSDAEGSFAGTAARNADQFMLSVANKMKDAGRPRDEIWQKTGWDLDNVDGKPRFEIDDSGATVDMLPPLPAASLEPRGALGDVMAHDDLFRAYPDLADARATQMDGRGGEYKPAGNGMFSDERITFASPSSALHESQHAIQTREGFAAGGNPDAMPGSRGSNYENLIEAARQMVDGGEMSIDQAMDWVSKHEYPDGLTPFEQYKRLAGETEARNVQSRLNMTAQERRQIPPWETADVPESEQIVRMRGDSPEYVAQMNADIRAASPVTRAVTDFSRRQTEKQSYWQKRRADLAQFMDAGDALVRPIMPAINTALAAVDLPMKGLYGLTSTLGAMASGSGFDASMQQGARVAQQPIEQTADEYAGPLADRGYPGTATALRTIMELAGPI